MEGYLAGGGLGADLSSGGNPAPTQFWTATLTEVQPAGGAGPGSRVASAQPGSWQAAPHGFQAPLQTLWPSTAQQVQQQPLWASQAEDRGGGLQPPPLPALQQQGTWAAAAADSMTWAVGNGRLDSETMAAKLAAAREKNRLAQQRFRERQRAKQREAGEQCDQLLREMEELRIENAALQQQNMIFGKVLAVRDAMVHTLSTLHARPQREEQQAAAQGLAYALEELPSELEMEEAAGSAGAAVVQQQQQPPQQQQQGQRRVLARTPSQTSAASTQPQEGQQAQQQPVPSGSSSPSGDRSANTAQHGAPPRWALVEHHRAGTAAQLDGSALQAVDSIPPPSDELIKATVMAMSEPEHLLDYYRQWQAELAASYLAAEAGGFDDASVAEVEAVQERMASVWWHVGHMKPAYLCYLTNAALPEDSAQFPLWRELAERLLPELDENSRAILRRAWFRYSKEMSKIAVKMSRWVRRLQQYTVSPVEAMASTARHSMELVDITTQLCSAVQEEYIASMEFLGDQALATTPLQKALLNKDAAPFMPDVAAIVWNVLCLDTEERRARGQAGPGTGVLGALDGGTAAAMLGGPPAAQATHD
ncbi:hypothetical protein ABPG77_001563 [Micractinium sp. CCAP 211/92]